MSTGEIKVSAPRFHVVINTDEDDGSLWATVEELPGVFASGWTPDELEAALVEAIGMYLSSPSTYVRFSLGPNESVADALRDHASTPDGVTLELIGT